MNIQRISQLPAIVEISEGIDVEREDVRVGADWNNSDSMINEQNAVRLSQKLANIPTTKQKQPTPQQPEKTTPKNAVKTWKNLCHYAAMTCGVAILPSFSFLAFGLLGLLAPACLTIGFIIFALLGGKPTKTVEKKISERREELSKFDSRGMT